MENRRKFLVAFLLIVGILVLTYALSASVEVGYPCGLALLLLGFAFWLFAE